MIRNVQKRDGRIADFDAEKIAEAIFLAAKAVGGEDRKQAEILAGQVVHMLNQLTPEGSTPQVEDIQDLVEKVLIENGHARTAKAFILYRNRRTRIREAKSELMDVVSEILKESGRDEFFPAAPANKLQRIALAASEQYALQKLLPREFALAHQRGAIHIDNLAHYALGPDTIAVDPDGFVHRGIASGAWFRVTSVVDVCTCMALLLLAAQQETAGEQTLCDADIAFSQAVAHLGLEPEPAQVAEGVGRMLHAFNAAPSPAGKQPTMSLSLGLADSTTGLMFSRAVLETLHKGVGEGQTALVPQLIFRVLKGYNAAPGEPAYDLTSLALGIASQCGNLSFEMVDEGNKACKRLGSGIMLPADSPGVVAKTFVNMPRLALEAASLSDLWTSIDATFSMVAKQLVHRQEVLGTLLPADLPFLVGQGIWAGMPDRKKPVSSLMREGRLLIVPVGTREAVEALVLRFAAYAPSEGDFRGLLTEICRRWRQHYALDIELGSIPATLVARRFHGQDMQRFPLAAELWADRSMYDSYIPSDSCLLFPGGGLNLRELSRLFEVSAGLVTYPYYERSCQICRTRLTNEDDVCLSCRSASLRVVERKDGYLVSREGAI